MALFNVIKFDGVPNKKWLAYKYPGNEFYNNSTLIVGVGQVAFAVHGGKIEHIFNSGTYKLSTENYPFIKSLVKLVHGGNVPFSMEIYFFNTTLSLKNEWGTISPIQMIDPKFNIKVRVRANGQYALKINDFQTFFSLLIGTMSDKTLYTFENITDMFRGIINTKISVIIGEYILQNEISFLNISMYLEQISEESKDKMCGVFNTYGLQLDNFYVSSINVPEDDLSKISSYLNKRAEFDIMGDDRYRVARTFDVMEKAASNENGGAGLFAASGIGLGIGMGLAPVVGQTVQQTSTTQKFCFKCGKELAADMRFCPHCGASQNLTCPKCSKELKPDMAFCPFCGTKI